jgi:cytidine deaminase
MMQGKNLLNEFPPNIRDSLSSIFDRCGVLEAHYCRQICQTLGLTIDQLMVLLLPIAASYAITPISNFKVGAVARGRRQDKNGFSNLYLGANLEFSNLALGNSLHAEQAAVSNAWLHDDGVISLATSAAPCGHCRQFLFEISGGDPFAILVPSSNSGSDGNPISAELIELNELLPAAFGPRDLGSKLTLMMLEQDTHKTNLQLASDDEVVKQALNAAQKSYAPYSQNFSACALVTMSGEIFTGRYAENVAFNPSLIAFTAALSQFRMVNTRFSVEQITRVILVEHCKNSSQKNVTEMLLKSLEPKLALEYYIAKLVA